MHANIILLVIIAVLVVGLLLWLMAASRRTRVERQAPAADEPVRRNQALIDAPPAAAVPPTILAAPVAVPVIADAVAPVVPLASASAVAGGGDDLTRLKGVGPKLADHLRALGVTGFAQIAAWDDSDIERIDAQLGRFQGRIRRDNWPEQARLLAAGDTAAYEAKFGKL